MNRMIRGAAGAVMVLGMAVSCGRGPEPVAPSAGQAAGAAGHPATGTGAAPGTGTASSQAASRSDKDIARTEPYANDLGPATLPADLIASYPVPIREGYELTTVRCAQCHDAARPLNSEFVDTETWRRYVKRMMAKPGCAITGAEGKKIWEFLVHDSKIRKTGAKASAWKAHRAALLGRFKAEHPERFQLLYGDKPKG